MSSDIFEVHLTPDPVLRKRVLVAGFGCGLLGCWLIIDAGIPLPWRLMLLTLWLVRVALDIARQVRGYRQVASIVLDADGRVRTGTGDGQTAEVTLLNGSVVYSRIAWLRLQRADGRQHGELLTGQRVGADSWHRLQLIWQLSREHFGHHGRA